MSEESKKEIQNLLNSIGALVEITTFLRDQLISHGYTRKEAVLICSNVISNQFGKSERKGDVE